MKCNDIDVKIIINADDFGLNTSCTKAICKAFEEGLITDTTMIANGFAFYEAVKCIKDYQLQDKIGVHFNITEGKPLTDAISKMPTFTENGVFHGKINRLKKLTEDEKQAVYEELSAQIKRLEQNGVKLTHADSHHHIHTGIFIAPIFVHVCKEHGVNKVRLHRNIGTIPTVKKIAKKVYNKWLKKQAFVTTKYFGSMSDVEADGVLDNLEIMVHPEFDKAGVLIDKVDEIDNCLIGKKLVLPTGNYILRGYKDL